MSAGCDGRQGAKREDLEGIARRLLVLVGWGMPAAVDRRLALATVPELRLYIGGAIDALELRAYGARAVGVVLTKAEPEPGQ